MQMLTPNEVVFAHIVDPSEDLDYWAFNHPPTDSSGTCGQMPDGTYYADVCVYDRYYVTARELPTLEAALLFAERTIVEQTSGC